MALVQNSSLLFIAMMIGNLSAYFFQLIMSRLLSTADFGVMNSCLSLCIIAGVPSGVILTVTSKYISKYKTLGDLDRLSRFYRNSLRVVLLLSVAQLLFFFVLSGPISSYLKITSRLPVILIGLVLFVSLVLTVNMGVLQGLQRFGYLGINYGISGILRLVAGIFLVYLGFGVNGAIAASVVAPIPILILSFIVLRSTLVGKRTAEFEPITYDIIGYTIPVIGALACFYALANFDLVMIKHYFEPEEAGLYSGVSVLGRALLFLPAAVALVLFPMVSASHTLNEDTFGILAKGLLLTGMLTGAGAVLYVLAPGFVLSTLLGESFAAASPLLRLYGFVMLPLALVNVVINFYLARSETKFIYILVLSVLLQVLLISLFHSNLYQVVYIMIGVSCIVMVATFAMLLVDRRRWVAAGEGKGPLKDVALKQA